MEIDDSLYRCVRSVYFCEDIRAKVLLCFVVCSVGESKKGSYGNITCKEQLLETTQLIYYLAESQNVSTHKKIMPRERRCSFASCILPVGKFCIIEGPLQPVYTSALDWNGSTQFELSHTVNANCTAPNRSKQDLQPPSNWSDPAPGVNAIEQRSRTRWAHVTGCHARVGQNGLMRRLSGFKSRCALTTPSV